MQAILRMSGRVARSTRKWPHWLKDLYGIVSYVNFIELVPTLALITLAPRHFFRRLPLVLARKKRLYQTPVKFFFNTATLFLLALLLRHRDLAEVYDHATVIWYMPLLIPATPVALAVIALACLVLYQLPRLIPSDAPFPQPNPHPFRLVLRPSSYWNLDLGRYLWGLFYISIYFVATWQVAQAVTGYSVVGTALLFAQLGDGHTAVKAIILILAALLATSVVHWLVFRPYAEMFRMSLRRPTRTVFEADVYDLGEEVAELLGSVDPRHTSADEIAPFCAALEHELEQLQGVYRQQTHDFTLSPEAHYARAQVLETQLQAEKLNSVLRQLAAKSLRTEEPAQSSAGDPAQRCRELIGAVTGTPVRDHAKAA